MSGDLFDNVLDLEEEFYQEGYESGMADGEHAGLVEGRVFGVERGYEKALEMGRLHGRAIVWRQRFDAESMSSAPQERNILVSSFLERARGSTTLTKNTRLIKNIETLLALVGDPAVAADNSDESVTKFDDRLVKARTKAKVIANVVGESVEVETSGVSTIGIEDAEGLNARR